MTQMLVVLDEETMDLNHGVGMNMKNKKKICETNLF
jgi:hypothetical protein